MNEKKMSVSDVIVIGFTMFAVFFGAGNLIFPPYLGMTSGDKWFIGFLCFMIADAGLAFMTVMAVVRGRGSADKLVERLGPKASVIVSAAAMICVGPLICIPRTAATTYEMGMLPLVPGFNSWIFSFLFFAVVYLMTIKPSGVVDIIGKVLTPMMLVTLAILFAKGVISPIGPMSDTESAAIAARDGIYAGYQTMDVLGAFAISFVLINNISQRGYREHKNRMKIMGWASIVATLGLGAVYGGLTYLGATTSLMDLGNINQTGLVVMVTELLLKRFGVVLLALIVAFACLTTAVGLVSSSAEYFSKLSKGRLSYERLVLIISVIGMVISNVGITVIINAATPILNIIYPIMLTQIVLSYFSEKIKNDNVFKGAAVGALIVCVFSVANDFGAPFDFVKHMPLAALGFNWVIPAIAGGVIGCFIPSKKKA